MTHRKFIAIFGVFGTLIVVLLINYQLIAMTPVVRTINRQIVEVEISPTPSIFLPNFNEMTQVEAQHSIGPTRINSTPPITNSEVIPNLIAGLSCTILSNSQCVETRQGLSLCRLNNVCVVKVNLNNNLRPKVAIASSGGTEWLNSIASRNGALVAINGDYFSGCPDTSSPLNCGEGLTYIDGSDFTDYSGNEWQNRRSLGFNDSFDPNIGMPGEQGGYHRQLLAGGPQVTLGGNIAGDAGIKATIPPVIVRAKTIL